MITQLFFKCDWTDSILGNSKYCLDCRSDQQYELKLLRIILCLLIPRVQHGVRSGQENGLKLIIGGCAFWITYRRYDT